MKYGAFPVKIFPSTNPLIESPQQKWQATTPFPLPRPRCPRPHVLQKRPADARSTAGADVIQWWNSQPIAGWFLSCHSCCFKASKLGHFGDFCSIFFHFVLLYISQSTAQFFSILWPKGDFFRLKIVMFHPWKAQKVDTKHVHSYMFKRVVSMIFYPTTVLSGEFSNVFHIHIIFIYTDA